MKSSVARLAVRTGIGAGLGWFVASALASSALPLPAKVAALGVIGLTMWQPVTGLLAAIALAPAGALLAPSPARTTELVVWSFVSAWLLALWRPLTANHTANRALVPAFLYALCAVASWIAYIVGGAAGTEARFLPLLVARAVPLDHLVFSSPEPETFTLMPALTGLALFAATATITREQPKWRMATAIVIAASAAALSLLTIADVIRQWAGMDYGGWFLLRYVRGERFSLHLNDLNAAGSHYVLAVLIAAGLAVGDRTRRPIWIALALLIMPALWISGSRSAAVGGLLVGGSLIPFVRRGVRVRPATVQIALAAVVLTGIALAAAVLAFGSTEQGTASNALRLRSQFLVTSARMFASAPAFGVGIGHYHERSNEFMPLALQNLYGYENAHNYFAQQFAELGLVGGALFVWLIASVLTTVWGHVRSNEEPASPALLVAASGYLLTCVTGHPLLVPEAALPFWGAFGALASTAPSVDNRRRSSAIQRWVTIAVVVLAVANVALHVRRYALKKNSPGEHGFYALETDNDGRPFVWMTRHGVFYVGPQPGTVTIPVRAPDFLEGTERFFVAIDIAGRRAAVYEATPGRWTTIEIPLRRPASTPFRRVDLRASRSWSPMRHRGDRADDQPRSVMVGETRWMPAGAR